MRLNFVVTLAYENYLTTKISRFMARIISHPLVFPSYRSPLLLHILATFSPEEEPRNNDRGESKRHSGGKHCQQQLCGRQGLGEGPDLSQSGTDVGNFARRLGLQMGPQKQRSMPLHTHTHTHTYDLNITGRKSRYCTKKSKRKGLPIHSPQTVAPSLQGTPSVPCDRG